ncbi:MAG: amidohydrolase family protein [Micromonosporaceae bacterium]|nr:amidohydrolase family protein [Micromonosporaceae bacterium]
MLVEDDRIAWLGPDDECPDVSDVVALDGALVTPAFVDAHVHATDTGVSLLCLDLSAATSAADLLDRLAVYAATLPADAVVLGHGFDESGWPSRRPPSAAELERAGGGRKVYLAQASVHSATCSESLLAFVGGGLESLLGYGDDGWLRAAAHHAVRDVAYASITEPQRRDAQRSTLRRAAGLGIAAMHECGGPGTSSEQDFTALLALPKSEPLPEVYGYWGELGAAAKARELGAVGAGGDLYADGALGSQTACLTEPYADTGERGNAYLDAEQVAEHIVDCAHRGMQGGFHAIGDAAIGAVVRGFSIAADKVGLERVRAGRHRVEHAEILDRDLIRGFVEFGLVASVQPAFDRLWGGEDKMYALRLGVARSLASNPLGSLASVGVALAFGSDSPVTPLDPWGSVRAAARHHNSSQRMTVRAGFAAHTRGGWRAVRRDDEGVLAPGGPATFAVWRGVGDLDRGLPALRPDSPLPTCARTVLRGAVIHDEEATTT